VNHQHQLLPLVIVVDLLNADDGDDDHALIDLD
jgi:hypothetical protein